MYKSIIIMFFVWTMSGRALNEWYDLTGSKVKDLNDKLAKYLKLSKGKGKLVLKVSLNSPAAAAGLKPYDIIMKINRHGVSVRSKMDKVAEKIFTGKPAKLTVWRKNKLHELDILLEKDWNKKQPGQW